MSPLHAIVQALFPTTCACCGEVLMAGESQLCVDCLSALDTTRSESIPDNATERILMGRTPYVAAMSLYRFQQGNRVQQAVHAMKFHGNCELCLMLGRQLGLALMRGGRFDDVDTLVPVPLHWWRRLQRGYNQSELLCRGISAVMERPVTTDAVVRHRYTRQQSLQQSTQRAHNVDGAFSVRRPHLLEGKHVLLVDDVMTTGATLTACADALGTVPGIRISVATLAIAQ